MLDLTESVSLDATRTDVFPFIESLDRYPAWLRFVHRAAAESDDVWQVELRASIGPFARSKQLRMRRTVCVENEKVVFEREELDGRHHANWVLTATLNPAGANERTAEPGGLALGEGGTVLTMHLFYDGRLWSGGLLQKALNDEIVRGREQLAALV